MANRESRINHPRGGIFIQVHAWAVAAVGRDAAGVLGALDFLDRAQPQPGQLVASRLRLLADLEGLVSRYGVDKALSDLLDLGWIGRVEKEVMKKKNITRTHLYFLVPDAINDFLKNQNSDVLNSERRRSEIGTGFGTDPGSEVGTSTVNKEEVEIERERGALSDQVQNQNPAAPQQWRWSPDRKKEADDLAYAIRIGREGGLSEDEIDAVITPLQYPSQAPAAARAAVKTKAAAAALSARRALAAEPRPALNRKALDGALAIVRSTA